MASRHRIQSAGGRAHAGRDAQGFAGARPRGRTDRGQSVRRDGHEVDGQREPDVTHQVGDEDGATLEHVNEQKLVLPAIHSLILLGLDTVKYYLRNNKNWLSMQNG